MLFVLIQDELVSPKIENVLPADFMRTGWQGTKSLHLHWSFPALGKLVIPIPKVENEKRGMQK